MRSTLEGSPFNNHMQVALFGLLGSVVANQG